MSEDFAANVAEIHSQADKDPRCRSFAFAKNAKEQVFRTDVLVALLQCLTNRELSTFFVAVKAASPSSGILTRL